MPKNNIASVYIVGILVGIYYIYKGFQWLNEKRLIEELPTSKVSSIGTGLVEVSGKAVPCVRSFRGPFTDKDCAHYICKVERLIRNNRGDEWLLINNEVMGDYFYLQDDTGKVLVYVKDAHYEIPTRFELKIDVLSKDMPDSLNNYLEAKHLKTRELLKYKSKLRFTEYDIEVSDKLFVLGTAEKNPLIDKNILEEDLVNVMIANGDNNDKFVISKMSEQELLKKLAKNSFLGRFGGGTLIIVCIYLFLMTLHLL
jgi:hypothetical protein